MRGTAHQLPDPTKDTVALWLQQLSSEELHKDVWIDINKRFHGVVMAARIHANKHFDGRPEEKAAFFDGLAIGLGALSHDADLTQIRAMFDTPAP